MEVGAICHVTSTSDLHLEGCVQGKGEGFLDTYEVEEVKRGASRGRGDEPQRIIKNEEHGSVMKGCNA